MIRSILGAIVILTSIHAPAVAADPARPHLLLVTESREYVHDVVKHRDGAPSVVEKTFSQLADKTHLFNVENTADLGAILTKEKLDNTRLIVFYTTGDLHLTPDQFNSFEQWIKNGGSFLGIHCATDTYKNHAVYPKLIGATFTGHPWSADATVTIKIDDPNHPATKNLPASITAKEEIYQFKNFDPQSVRVLISLDMEKTTPKQPHHIPIAWCKTYGKGKVFYTSLGHREDVWESDWYQKHLIGAISWLLDAAPGDSTPNPDVSQREEELARKAAAAAPASDASKPSADKTPKGPTVPEGFSIHTFVAAPDIHSPAGIAVTPDGKLFVGEDEYNSQPSREQGLSRVKLCVDTDNDGKADKITIFADKLNSPQGMTFVGGTLFVVHAPFLTALRDTDNDGIADSREELVRGLGPVPEGLVHHIPNGIRIGVDGWLYVAIGDKGIKDAIGKDGRHISMLGGGIVRVRPDGSELQIFCTGNRNIYDVAIDPLLNIFTRDNTNDGDGWNTRLSKMQRDGIYGYPSLFKNYAEEIVPCLADYGAGGATGSLYVQEPGFPSDFGDCLYTTDWARGIIYRHRLTPDGATFKVTQDEFLKGAWCTHEDVDGLGRIYIADWGRRDWGNNSAAGAVHRVKWEPKPATQPTTKPASMPAVAALTQFPDMSRASQEQLIEYISSPSAVCRREAQAQLLARGNSPSADAALKQVISSSGALFARVAALNTLTQLMGTSSHTILIKAAEDPALREFALRALADRDRVGGGREMFLRYLHDPDARVRVQAAIAIGKLADASLCGDLLPLTADKDVMVRQAAMQSIRQLNNPAAAIAALSNATPIDIVNGALRTLRSMHHPAVVSAMKSFMQQERRQPARREAIKTLGRLYHVESPYDGGWWMTRPDTRGPYYKPVAWQKSGDVADILIRIINDPDPELSKLAIAEVGRTGMSEAAPVLSAIVEKESGPLSTVAAAALIEMKSSSPDVLSALEKIALSATFDVDVRGKAAAALGAGDSPLARAAVLKLVSRLDHLEPPVPPVLDKASDALAGRGAAAGDITAVSDLLNNASQKSSRIAAASCLLRGTEQPVKDRVALLWKEASSRQLEAMLIAASRLPVELGKAYLPQVRAALLSTRPELRHAALVAVGHLDEANAVKDLLAASSRSEDRIAAATALASVEPAKASDKQVSTAAQFLVLTTGLLMRGSDRDAYARVLAGAQRFAEDKRIPKEQAEQLLSQLKQTGVIAAYRRTGAIAAGDAKQSFSTVYPPERVPAGPFQPFQIDGKTYDWKPITVTNPQGVQRLEMPANSVVYLTCTYDAVVAGSGLLTCGSDDGIQVWLNGNKIHSNDIDRAPRPDLDKVPVALQAGTNVMLFKINNHGDGSGIEARLRSRPAEFEIDELVAMTDKLPTNPDRGKQLFSSLGCVKCHTTDPDEEPKGPFLGGVGSKFDQKYLAESILRPSAKIAQGFSTNRIVARDGAGHASAETIGFIAREGSTEVQLRDLTGKVTVIEKSGIAQRELLPGSMMPEGLADALSLEDFRALLSYLTSLKEAK
jgi:putative membrane-bound dehydrogenase-like protein